MPHHPSPPAEIGAPFGGPWDGPVSVRLPSRPDGAGAKPARRRVAVAAVVVLLLGACGSDGDEGGRRSAPTSETPETAAPHREAGGPPDPCALLDEREIEARFGGPVGPASVREDVLCEWRIGEGPMSATSGVFQIGLGNGLPNVPPGEPWELNQQSAGEGAVAVDGVGDAAFYKEASLAFSSGDLIVMVGATFAPPPDDTQERLTELARLIEERL